MELPMRESMPERRKPGSAPLRGEKGAPLCKERPPENCQPPTSVAHEALLVAEPGQFVNSVDDEAVRPIVGRTGAFSAAVEAILRNSNFARNGDVEDLRLVVDERAPGVVAAEGEVAGEPLLQDACNA